MPSAAVHARVTLPQDCLTVVAPLIEKLGGTFSIEDTSEDVVIVPSHAGERTPGENAAWPASAC